MLISPPLLLAIILIAAFALLLSNKLSPDVVALCVALALGLTGVLTADEMVAGFSSPAVITILGAFIMTHALYATGVTRRMGQFLTRASATGSQRLLALVMLFSAGLSLVMNKIVAAAVLLPAVTDASSRARVPLARLGMPLAFATSLGGMATLLNTGNLVVSSALRQSGFEGYGLLDFMPVGLPIAALGIAFIMLTSERLLPGAKAAQATLHAGDGSSEKLSAWYELGERLNEVRVLPESPLANLTIAESNIGERFGLALLALARKNRVITLPAVTEVILPGDRLIVVGRRDRVLELEALGLHLEAETEEQLERQFVDETALFEVLLSPRTLAVGQTVKSMRFRERYGGTVIAIWHGGRSVRTDLANLPLQHGDSLLVYGNNRAISALRKDPDFILLRASSDAERPVHADKAPLALAIIAVILLISALGLLPVAEAMLLGAVIMVITGCLKMEEAYRAVDWRAIFLIAGMSSVSIAMLKTGAAATLGSLLTDGLASSGPLMVAFGLLLITMLVTQVVSGQVAAFFVAPIAISAALTVGVDPRAMAMYVAFGASLTFLTPAAHTANLLVMGAGGYTPRSYLRLGVPLTLLLIAGILVVVPLVFGW